MAITIRCGCGASFEVQLSQANSFGRCPQPECRAWVRIPPEGILSQYEGQAIAAADLEATIPDRRRLEFEPAPVPLEPAPVSPPAPQCAPVSQDDELPTLSLDEPAAPPRAQTVGQDDLPALEPVEPIPPASQPPAQDDGLPTLSLDEPAVASPRNREVDRTGL